MFQARESQFHEHFAQSRTELKSRALQKEGATSSSGRAQGKTRHLLQELLHFVNVKTGKVKPEKENEIGLRKIGKTLLKIKCKVGRYWGYIQEERRPCGESLAAIMFVFSQARFFSQN